MTAIAERLERRASAHRRWATLATVAACGLALVAPAPPLEQQMLLVGIAVAVLGFPHGALDPLVAMLDGRRHGPAWIAGFLAAYLAIAGAVVGLWIAAPMAGLAVFLITSAVHFGLGDVPASADLGPRARALRVAAHGAAPIVLPAALHPEDVGTVFGWLLGSDGAGIVASLSGASATLLIGWFVVAALAYATPAGRRREGLIELGLLALTFAVLPPLLSFAVYFCAWHSARHLITVDTVLGNDLRTRGAVVGLAVLAATALLLVAAQAAAAEPASIRTAARTIFVALAALTPPHMIVTSLLARRVAR